MHDVNLGPNDFVNHRCANPKCIRIEHLYVGDAQDNANDTVEHGHSVRGEDVHNNVLTVEQVREARTLYALGVKVAKIARDMGVKRTTLSRAIHRGTFTWLDPE